MISLMNDECRAMREAIYYKEEEELWQEEQAQAWYENFSVLI